MMHLKRFSLLMQVMIIFLIPSRMLVSAQGIPETNNLQQWPEYNKPGTYTIQGIRVTGAEYLDEIALKSIAGIKEGDQIEIPGPRLTNAMKRLWDQGLMDDIEIKIDSLEGEKAYLNIFIAELTRLSGIEFKGIKKGQRQALEDQLGLSLGKIITSSLIRNSEYIIQEYFREKGFYEVSVDTRKIKDSNRNTSKLIFNISVNKKYRISRILIHGNQQFSDRK